MQFSPLLVDTVYNLHADFFSSYFYSYSRDLLPKALYPTYTYITEMASSTEVEYDIPVHGLIYKKTGEHVE